MFNKFPLFLMLFLTGCWVYVEPSDSHYHREPTGYVNEGEVCLYSPYVECTYDAYWDLSRWYFEIYADSYYGPTEVESVEFYINNHNLTIMDYEGSGVWSRSLTSTYYDCDRSLHFDFTAFDYEGYEGNYTYYW